MPPFLFFFCFFFGVESWAAAYEAFSCQKENVVRIKHYEHKTQHYLSESITLCHLC